MANDFISRSTGPLHTDWQFNKKGSFPFVKPNRYKRLVATETLGINLEQWYTPKGSVAQNVSALTLFNKSIELETSLERNLLYNLQRKVHNRALSKLDAELTVCSNFFESWYERREVYNMVGTVGKELLDFATNFRKPKYWKRKGKKVKRPETLPEAWLTYQFGIVPLVGTLDAAMKGLGKPLAPSSFKSTSSAPYSGKFSNDPSVESPTWVKGTYRKTIGCTGWPNPNPNVALANLGGLTTPFSTSWSVIPWGWAIDYFVNVSQLLQNVELKHPGVTCSDWYETEKFDTTWIGYCVGRTVPHRYRLSGVGSQMTRRVISKPDYKPVLDFPLLGSNSFANLFSALALTMKGK